MNAAIAIGAVWLVLYLWFVTCDDFWRWYFDEK